MSFISSALVLKRGAGTAIIAYSHQNFMYNQNASNKSLLGHYTLYAKVMNIRETNVVMKFSLFTSRILGIRQAPRERGHAALDCLP